MSVEVIDPEDYGHLAASLRQAPWQPDLLTVDERLDLSHLPSIDPDAFFQSVMWAWCGRLFIANQLAYEWQYNKRRDLPIELHFLQQEIHSSRAPRMDCHTAYQLLQKIDYNLHTNEGHSFVSQADRERIIHAMRMAASHLLLV